MFMSKNGYNCLIVSIVFILIQGCYYDVEEDLYPSTSICDTSLVTYSQTVRPILDNNCMNCHSQTASMGNVVLESYSDVLNYVNSGQLVGAINHDPNFSAMPQGEAKLDDCTILKIETWVLAGSPEN